MTLQERCIKNIEILLKNYANEHNLSLMTFLAIQEIHAIEKKPKRRKYRN